MSGQIVDATIIAVLRQRNTEDEKKAIKEGRIPEDWQDRPKKLAQKDRDARWTVKQAKARPVKGGKGEVEIAIPVFGYKNHVSIERTIGVARARVKIGLANIAYNVTRLIWLKTRPAAA